MNYVCWPGEHGGVRDGVLRGRQVQGDQLNMAVFFWYLVTCQCPVYATVPVYTGQVAFSKVPEKHIEIGQPVAYNFLNRLFVK